MVGGVHDGHIWPTAYDAPFFRMVTIETPKFRYYKHDSGHHNHDFRKAETILV